MSWRTVRLLIYLGLWCLVFEGITITAVVMASLTYIFSEPLWEFIKIRWKEFGRKRLFTICFIDHPPPGEHCIDLMQQHPIPVGESDHFIRIRCNEGIKIGRFNLRFIDINESTADPADGPIDIRSTLFIREVHIDPPDVTPYGEMRSEPIGGIHFIFNELFDWGKGKALSLRVKVAAENKQWSGKLSFEALDPDNKPRQVRRDVVIMPGLPVGPSIPFAPVFATRSSPVRTLINKIESEKPCPYCGAREWWMTGTQAVLASPAYNLDQYQCKACGKSHQETRQS